jgi:hypothetical protein
MERKIIHLEKQNIKEHFESQKYSPNKDDSEILPDRDQKN